MRHGSRYPLSFACVLCLLALAMALAACAAPSASPDALGPALPEQSPSPDPDNSGGPADQQQPAPAAGQASPPSIPRPTVPGAAALDYACDSDDDCAVKNVGNCCGYYPACVNADSPTDPAAVKAECAKTGRVGVCGFPAISSCQCVQGRCEGSNQMLPSL